MRATNIVGNKIKALGLRIAPTKTTLLMCAHGHKGLESIELEVLGAKIISTPTIKYLGVYLDPNWDFRQHLVWAAERANKVGNKLARIMPNLRGPREKTRKLYTSVIHSMLMYGAPVWQTELTKRKIAPLINIQNNMARRVIAAYRTVAGVAARVLARVPPADILAKKYRDTYERIKEARTKLNEGVEIPGRIMNAIRQKANKEMIEGWKAQLEEPGKPAAQIREWVSPST